MWRAADLVALRHLAGGGELPPHLAGVPRCLHKYEPLLCQAWERRGQSETDGQSAAETAAA